jgi:hypothetical protein
MIAHGGLQFILDALDANEHGGASGARRDEHRRHDHA